jgi:hypothetical protein
MKSILELIKLIYGSKALSKILGTRTNVIRLPDNEVKRYIKEELNIEAASDKLAQKAKEEMGELIADLPKMNDAEKLILEGNLRRLANKLGVAEKGPAADVIQFTTKEKISPEGVMSLTEKIGQKNAPGTLMGNLESRIKQLEASGEDLSKLKGKTYDEFMKDITQGQKSMRKLEDEGLVRATAREIIGRDIKSGKIKLPKEIEQDIVQGGGEPINVFRKFYGEDALEQLDSMIPEFKNMYSPREAADAATKKFKFEFKADRPPESISIEDAKKAEQEFGINKPKQNEVTDITAKVYRNADPDELIGEYNKNLDLLSQVDEEGGTLIGYEQFKKLQNRNTEIEKILNSIGIKSADSPEGKKITEALIGKPKASVTELVTAEKIISDMKNMDPMDAMKEANKVLKKEGKYKNLQEKDVERIMEDTNDFIFGRDIPEDPEGFAVGGRVEMAAGGITKLVKKAMEFFSDNDPVSAYKKYLKYVKETAQKDPAKLAPEMGGIVVGSELIHRGLRRKLKEAKEKNNTDDSEDTTTEYRTEKAGGGVSQGLDYLTGIERRGYANGDYAIQAGIKNYLGKQKTATVPIKWKSGKDHPDTELAYITKPEKDLLIKLDMHNSMPDGEPNIGPGGLISLNSGGDGGAGGGDGGNGDGGDDGGNGDGGDDGGNGDGGSNASDTGDTGSEAGNDAASASAAAGGSGSSGTDTGDMGSEAANAAATSAANASVGMGGPTDTGDLGSEAANDAATAAGAASVGMGTLSSYSRPGMVATNISNYMKGNPGTSLGLTALGAMMGMPGLGVMNAVNSVYGGGSSGSSTGSGQGEDGSGDGGDGRTPISSFDSALLTPDLLDSYNLAKNRDYRLFQSSNNPFYSLQRNPSGGINNVYTEFKKGGRVGFAEGGSMSKGLDYLSGVERRGYVGGGFGSGLVDPMEAMYVNTFGFNPFPKYGFNSYMDYNTARITGTPMNQNISDLEDYLGTLESAREINLPGVTKDLSAEDISRLQEEYVKKMAKTSNALNPTVTASTAASTPDYRQQALSEMLSRYNVSSLGDIKNFNYLIPGYKDKNNLEVRAFETRIPDLAVSRRAQQLEDAAIRAQQDQEAYKNRISQVDPNALRNSYLQNLQNTSSQSIDQFQSKLRSNLVPRKQAAQGLNYLTGL